MDESVHLGRIAGVRVGINWSLLVVFWLIAWGLASSELPHAAPHHFAGAYWAAGLAAAIAFYACLLAHELAHSVVARRAGLVVEGIVLWLFGGVSRFKEEAATPETELRVSLAGPATSLGLALVFWAVTLLIGDRTSVAAAATGWLGWINAILGVFNLVPAFPLDGGRVLRAVLWRRHGDKERATTSAARAGEAFGYLLIALGLLEFLAGANLGGLWLVFLGWFLLAAARAEAGGSALNAELAGLKVADVMTPNPLVAPAELSVERLLQDWVYPNRCSTFPLVDGNGRPVGLITIARLKQIPATRRPTTTVSEIACPLADVVTCTPSEELIAVVRRMARSIDQRALVLEGERLVGIVSPSDVTRAHEHARLARP
jgi:Zn-dependent protease/CBS domain-containing protein